MSKLTFVGKFALGQDPMCAAERLVAGATDVCASVKELMAVVGALRADDNNATHWQAAAATDTFVDDALGMASRVQGNLNTVIKYLKVDS